MLKTQKSTEEKFDIFLTSLLVVFYWTDLMKNNKMYLSNFHNHYFEGEQLAYLIILNNLNPIKS